METLSTESLLKIIQSYQITAYFASLLIFVGFITTIVIRYGIQESVSDSFYALKRWGSAFTFFTTGFSITLLVASPSWLLFTAVCGILIVGIAANFHMGFVKTFHFVAAYFCAIMSQLSIAIDYKMYWLNIVSVIICLCIVLVKAKNRTWWLEMVAFIAMYVAITIHLFFS